MCKVHPSPRRCPRALDESIYNVLSLCCSKIKYQPWLALVLNSSGLLRTIWILFLLKRTNATGMKWDKWIVYILRKGGRGIDLDYCVWFLCMFSLAITLYVTFLFCLLSRSSMVSSKTSIWFWLPSFSSIACLPRYLKLL